METKKLIVLEVGVNAKQVASSMACCTTGPKRYGTE